MGVQGPSANKLIIADYPCPNSLLYFWPLLITGAALLMSLEGDILDAKERRGHIMPEPFLTRHNQHLRYL